VTGMSGRAEGSAMYMERGVVDVLRERLTDDKPTVRGKALSSLGDITVRRHNHTSERRATYRRISSLLN